MAQVGVQQPTNLMEMFSSESPMLWDIASQQVNDQTLGNLINRQQAQQAMDFAAQEQPFKLDQFGLANQTTRAQLPGVQADSTIKQNNAKISTDTLDAQTKAKLSELATKVSDDDLKQSENAIQLAMQHPNPQVREVGNQMFEQIAKIKEMRIKAAETRETQAALEGLRGEEARKLEEQQYTHGKYLKPFSAGIDVQIRAAKNPEEKMLKIQQAYQEATDETAKQHYQDLYEAVKPLYDNYMAAKINKPGQIDPSALTGMQPVQAPVAPAAPGKPATQPEAEASDKLDLTPAAITKAFGNYEPNKYQYRINPQTGKLQRKPL